MPLQIDLWLWPLDLPAARAAALAGHLSEEEEVRGARFLRARDGLHFRTGRGRMREILAGYAGGAPRDLVFEQNRFGRPSLHGGPAFNLSHSGGWAALAVAPAGTELGIDIEAYREIEHGVARRFFSAAECQALAALDPACWPDGFFRAWTRKEALVKAIGDGLNLPLADFDVSLAPDAPAALVASRTEALDPREWTLLHLDLAPRFSGCVAVRAMASDVTLRVREGALPIA
jgi:4'-phosphopantetheinyl transferase